MRDRPPFTWAEPLRLGPNHGGPVGAVAGLTLPDGRTLIITGGGDGTVRRWDATTGQPVGDPLTGHTGWVWSVAGLTLPDGRTLIITGSNDWSLILWPVLPDGRVGGEFAPGPGTEAVGRTDETEDSVFVDVLGRGVMAAHLEQLLAGLAGANKAGTAVVHVDGRWGSGKSRLITLLDQRLGQRPDGVSHRLEEPVVIRYDAWRESAVAPEWWSLATAIHRSVRGHRALAARVAMTGASFATRTVRSVPLLIATGLLVALLIAQQSGWWSGNVEGLSKTLTALSALAAFGIAVGRNLFWSSPTFGRLYLRSDDNPLGQVAAVVTSLRRWSPRRMRTQRAGDSVVGIVLGASVAWAAGVVVRVPATAADVSRLTGTIGQHWQPLAAAGVSALLVAGAVLGQHARAPRRSPWPDRWRRAYRRLPWRLRHRLTRLTKLAGAEDLLPAGPVGVLLGLGVGGVAGYLVFSFGTPAPLWQVALRHPLPVATAAVLAAGVAGGLWIAVSSRSPRRPLVLVIDDLDRCPADRVVKLLETVHTLLREPSHVGLFRRWRRAAPFVVLVLADGRWIRQAFETSFDKFQPLGSDVHGLGSDFLQKVFDHVVLVPPLAADQVQAYVDDVTELSHWASTGRATRATPPTASGPAPAPAPSSRPPTPPDVRRGTPDRAADSSPDTDGGGLPPDGHDAATSGPSVLKGETDEGRSLPSEASPPPPISAAEQLLQATPPSRALGPALQQAIVTAPVEDRQRLAEAAAAKAASRAAIAAFSEHLLGGYTSLMPANPRLVTRVANTFGMLMTIRLHLNHNETDDYVARAAILMVRFPTLMDQLLSEADPPNVDPASATPAPEPATTPGSPWHRRDVQQLLRASDGALVDIVRLARCFGREYAPPVPHPPPTPTPATAPAPAEPALSVATTGNGASSGTAPPEPHTTATDTDGSTPH